MVNQSRSVSATFVGGGITVIGGSTVYLTPPNLYLGWVIGLILCLGCPFGIFVWNQRRLTKEEDDIGDLSEPEIEDILDDPPSLKIEVSHVEGGDLLGYRLLTTIKIRNGRDVILDGLEVSMEATDLDRNTIRSRDFAVPDLLPKESQEQTFKVGLGRRLSERYKVICIVHRWGVEVARKHFNVEKQLFGYFRYRPSNP